MDQGMKHVLRIGVDCPRDFLRCFSGPRRKLVARSSLQLQKSCGRLFPSFDPWLMISIDVYQRPVKSDCAFIERNQGYYTERVCFRNADSDGFAIFLV